MVATHRPRIALKITIRFDSLYWGLITYYNTLSSEQKNQQICEAAQAYWGPLVTLETNFSDSEMTRQEKTWVSINRLLAQINQITSTVEISQTQQYTKPLKVKGSKDIEWDFSYRPNDTSQRTSLIAFLSSNTTPWTKEQKLLESGLAYWDWWAYLQLGLLSEEQMIICATNCVIRLQQQISFLGNYLGLKPNFPIMRDVNPLLSYSPMLVPQPTLDSAYESPMQNRFSRPETEEYENNNQTDDTWGLELFSTALD